jgi:hypothetical protein
MGGTRSWEPHLPASAEIGCFLGDPGISTIPSSLTEIFPSFSTQVLGRDSCRRVRALDAHFQGWKSSFLWVLIRKKNQCEIPLGAKAREQEIQDFRVLVPFPR